MPCDRCPRRQACHEICAALEKRLPSLDDSRINHGHIRSSQLRKLLHHRKVVRVILGLRPHLTEREREVINLVYNRSLTLEEAVKYLRIPFPVAYRYLDRAYLKVARLISDTGIPREEVLKNHRRKKGV